MFERYTTTRMVYKSTLLDNFPGEHARGDFGAALSHSVATTGKALLNALVLDQSDLESLAIDDVDCLTGLTLGLEVVAMGTLTSSAQSDTDALPAPVMVPAEVSVMTDKVSHFMSQNLVHVLSGGLEVLHVEFQLVGDGVVGGATDSTLVTDDEVDGTIEAEEVEGFGFDFFQHAGGFLASLRS